MCVVWRTLRHTEKLGCREANRMGKWGCEEHKSKGAGRRAEGKGSHSDGEDRFVASPSSLRPRTDNKRKSSVRTPYHANWHGSVRSYMMGRIWTLPITLRPQERVRRLDEFLKRKRNRKFGGSREKLQREIKERETAEKIREKAKTTTPVWLTQNLTHYNKSVLHVKQKKTRFDKKFKFLRFKKTLQNPSFPLNPIPVLPINKKKKLN